ncbi:DNA-binding response regulator [Hwanghaeella sp. LZ110]|uniref:DNA-binding response regulator n=1 Tax=Hwanghaeella sp. LZ110 TaxID=3402810 RepID=UPI003B679A22
MLAWLPLSAFEGNFSDNRAKQSDFGWVLMSVLPSIAFVDDEPKILSGIRRGLKKQRPNWDLAFFENPIEALQNFKAKPPRVVVVDIRMPQMNGLDLAREINKSCPGTLCIVLSGSTDFDIAIASINDGNVFRYYVKPCSLDILIDGIEEALSTRRRRADDQPNTARMAGSKMVDSLSAGALDLIRYGVLVADSDGHALFTNAKAGRMLTEQVGLSLDANGFCRAANTKETERLHLAIAKASNLSEMTALTLISPDGTPLRVTVQPYEAESATNNRLVCLFLFSDDQVTRPNPKLLMDMFSLTVSESRLAAALAGGMSLEDAAQECGLTRASARTYLKNIFSKLDVTRQSELVRTILISLANSTSDNS